MKNWVGAYGCAVLVNVSSSRGCLISSINEVFPALPIVCRRLGGKSLSITRAHAVILDTPQPIGSGTTGVFLLVTLAAFGN
jgi:hypothetical protein